MLTIIIDALVAIRGARSSSPAAIHAKVGTSSEFHVCADPRSILQFASFILHFAFPAPPWRREFCERNLL
jgi:hypothetical protein